MKTVGQRKLFFTSYSWCALYFFLTKKNTSWQERKVKNMIIVMIAIKRIFYFKTNVKAKNLFLSIKKVDFY